MKKTETMGYLLVIVAFVLKLYKIHYHTWIIFAAIIFLIIVYVTMKVRKAIEADTFFIGLSSVFFFIWLLFLTKFWPMPVVPMVLGFCLLLAGIVVKFKNKNTLSDGRQWINLFIMIICFIVLRMPNDQRYYLTAIRFNYEIDSDYRTWSKYSWFLYNAEKYEESFKATDKALFIANEHRDEFWVEKIIYHQEMIKDRSWDKY